MRENSAGTTCQHGSHPAAIGREDVMTNGVHPPMHAMKPASSRPLAYCAQGETNVAKLRKRDHAVLALSKPGQNSISWAWMSFA